MQSISSVIQATMSNPSSGNLSNMSKPFDSVDIECVYAETIQALRPGFRFTSSYAEACERVTRMEEEIKENLMKAVPNFEQLVVSSSSSSNSASMSAGGDAALADAGGLRTIREDEEEYDEDNEDEDEDNYSGGNGAAADDDEYGFDVAAAEDDEDTRSSSKRRADLDELDDDVVGKARADSMNADSNAGSEVDDAHPNSLVNLVQHKKHQEMSKEDEEFIKAFDSLVTENIAVFNFLFLHFFNMS